MSDKECPFWNDPCCPSGCDGNSEKHPECLIEVPGQYYIVKVKRNENAKLSRNK